MATHPGQGNVLNPQKWNHCTEKYRKSRARRTTTVENENAKAKMEGLHGTDRPGPQRVMGLLGAPANQRFRLVAQQFTKPCNADGLRCSSVGAGRGWPSTLQPAYFLVSRLAAASVAICCFDFFAGSRRFASTSANDCWKMQRWNSTADGRHNAVRSCRRRRLEPSVCYNENDLAATLYGYSNY